MYPSKQPQPYYPPPPPPTTDPYYPPPPPPTTDPYYPPPQPTMGVPVPTPPGTFQIQTPAGGAWSTGLCECCDDGSNCCITCFCPCVTFGQIAEIVDKGATSCGTSGALYALIMYVTCCQCLYSCFYRSKLRAQLGLREEPCTDCLVHCCCETCSLCQMYRELNRRGYDMSIGWHANMERQGQPATIPPPVQGMIR